MRIIHFLSYREIVEMNGLRRSASRSQMVKTIDVESSSVLLEPDGGCGNGEVQSALRTQQANCPLWGLSQAQVPSETSTLREIRQLPWWFAVFRGTEIEFLIWMCDELVIVCANEGGSLNQMLVAVGLPK